MADRQKFVKVDALLYVAFQLDRENRKIKADVIVNTHGLIPYREIRRFSKEITNIIESFLLNAKDEQLESRKVAQSELRSVLRRHIVRTKKRYPIIIPIIFYT